MFYEAGQGVEKSDILKSEMSSMLVGDKCNAEARSWVSRKWCGARAWDPREGAVVVRPAAVVLRGALTVRLAAVDNALRSVLYSILHNCLLQ